MDEQKSTYSHKNSCLASQHIRDKITKHHEIILAEQFTEDDEDHIQPSSFEPTIGQDIYVLDTETAGLLKPTKKQTIYQALLTLPARQRKKYTLTEKGFELKKGHTYIIQLREKVILSEHELIRSSPKSSIGRVFLRTRLLTDYNPTFEEINAYYKKDVPLSM